MSLQTDISMKLKLTAEGIKEATADSEKLNQSLEKGQAIANRPKSVSAAYKAAQTSSENVEEARAVSGRGGSGGARDFARESQGLGGLVRLYAVWAANVYAVGTAFDALSKAANTTGLIAGMNELGVASGVALGAVSKRFQDATGDAISFQQAARNTTRAIAAGLSTTQLTGIGEVAAKASRALGVDMEEAITRVTKGITKMQPRMLEELDIFTKINPAVREYALQTGKSISSITEFEKQQAFANAAIAEGKRKFDDVNIAPNPYSKLSASVKDLTQNGLELINKFLGPVISLLASSPTALTGVMIGLGTVLLKQAIPAIGQYRESLGKSADYAVQVWEKKNKSIQELEKKQYDYIINSSEVQADKRLEKFEKAESRIAKLKTSSGSVTVGDVRAASILGSTSYADVSKSDISYLKKLGKDELAAGNTDIAKYYREAALALDYWIKAEKEHSALLQQIDTQTKKAIAEASPLSYMGAARDELAKAERSKTRTSIISQVAADASIGTFTDAWKNMNKSIADSSNLTAIDKGLTKIGSAATLAVTGITRVISVLSGIIGWVGTAIFVFETLYGLFSTNGEAAEKLGKSLTYAAEVSKTATATFAKFNDTLTVEGLTAKSNALSGLADSIKETASNFAEFNKSSSAVDNAYESVKHLFGLFGGFSKQDYAADSIAKQVMLMLNNLDDPALKETAQTKLKGILNIEKFDFKNLTAALKDVDASGLEKVSKAIEVVGIKSQATSLALTSVKNNFKAVDDAFTALENSLTPRDPLSTYASSLVAQAHTLSEALKDPKVAAAELGEIVKDSGKLTAFPPEVANQIRSISTEYTRVTKDIENSKEKIKELNIELAKGAGPWTSLFEGKKIDLEAKIKLNTASLIELGQKLEGTTAKSMEQAFSIAVTKASGAMQQAAIDTQKTILGGLPKSEATIKYAADLEVQSIKIREREITAIYELTQEYKKAGAREAVKDAEKAYKEAAPGEDAGKAFKVLQEAQSNLRSLDDKNLAKNRGQYIQTPELFKQMTEQSGYSQQLQTLLGQEKNIKLKASVDAYALSLDNETKAAQQRVDLQTKAFTELQAADEYKTKSLEEQAALKEKFTRETEADRLRIASAAQIKDIAVTGYAAALPGAGAQIKKVAETDLPGRQEDLATSQQKFKLDEETAALTAKSALAAGVATREYTRQQEVQKEVFELAKLRNESDIKSLDSQQQMLDVKKNLGLIDDESYKQRTDFIKSQKVEIDLVQQLLALEDERAKKIQAIDLEIDKAGGSKNVEPKRLTDLENQRAAANTLYKEQKAGVESVTQGLRDQQKLTDAMSVRMQGYSSIVEGAFKNMADALADFAKTGKLDFAGLIDSMIADLVRFELETRAKELYTGAGGLTGILGSIFGKGPQGAVANPMQQDPMQMAMGNMAAKGAAYDYGVHAFAKGGTFSNSIVDSPTLFKFASGTGLMGEAGPEAIMPLKRDGNGNLGVQNHQGGGGNVDVTVHNYGSEKAQTRESTDARGNRKIEIVIGEAAAADMTTNGSASQKAMGGTYGIRPQLIRR